mgnify:CR=1 FL=1
MVDRQLFKETFSQLHASPDTVAEVLTMAREQEGRRYRKPIRMGAVIALAAVLLMGSALAAVGYKLHADRLGELAMAISVAGEGQTPGAVAFGADEVSSGSFRGLDMTPGWLPEGFENVPGETIKWDDPEDGWRGGFSLGNEPLEADGVSFCDVVLDAESQENLTLGGHEAIYVKLAGDSGFNQRMYISYPEYNAVLIAWIGANVDRDTAVRFAENLDVAPGDWEMSGENMKYTGRLYADMAHFIATGVYENTADEDATEPENAYVSPASLAAAEDMANERQLGESFTIRALDHGAELTELTVKVTDVKLAEDVSILRDPQYLDGDVARLLDENGKLPEDTLRFVVFGDGVTTPLAAAVAEQTQQPKLVAVTVDFTNDTDETITDTVFRGQLMAVEETESGWTEYRPVPENGAEYDEYVGTSFETLMEMRYFDVVDTESNGGNHLRNLAPGETVTVQMGFVVNECEAEHLWFYFDSGMNEVSEGYVALHP